LCVKIRGDLGQASEWDIRPGQLILYYCYLSPNFLPQFYFLFLKTRRGGAELATLPLVKNTVVALKCLYLHMLCSCLRGHNMTAD